MSSTYINGVSFPIVKIKDTSGAVVDTINLDLCGANGLIEEYTEDFKRVVLGKNKKKIDYDFKGTDIIFILDYSEYSATGNLFDIELIKTYNRSPELYNLFLIPHSDLPGRSFQVRLEDGKYSQRVIFDEVGHELPILRFVTIQPGETNFLDPNAVYCPGFYNMGFI